MPAAESALKVPPVESSSTPRLVRARARSIRPVLSETESRARRMGMYPVGVSKAAGAVNGAARLPRKLPETRLRCRPMFARMPFASLSRWGRTCLVLSLAGLPLFASCTTSEDTEPFVPAVEGATQPGADGALISEDDACDQLLKAEKAAYKRLGCDAPSFPECPGFLRPGGGSGCYEYSEGSVK